MLPVPIVQSLHPIRLILLLPDLDDLIDNGFQLLIDLRRTIFSQAQLHQPLLEFGEQIGHLYLEVDKFGHFIMNFRLQTSRIEERLMRSIGIGVRGRTYGRLLEGPQLIILRVVGLISLMLHNS